MPDLTEIGLADYIKGSVCKTPKKYARSLVVVCDPLRSPLPVYALSQAYRRKSWEADKYFTDALDEAVFNHNKRLGRSDIKVAYL